MDYKQSSISTEGSAFFTELTPFEAVVAVFDREERTLKLYLEKSINCPSNKHVIYAGKLIETISTIDAFPGTVFLQPPQSLNTPSSMLAYFREEESIRHTTSLMGEYRVCYKWESFLESPSDSLARRALEDFSKCCEFAHQLLQKQVDKYRVESRVNYYKNQLANKLREHRQGRQPKQEVKQEVESKAFDRRADIFESN